MVEAEIHAVSDLSEALQSLVIKAMVLEYMDLFVYLFVRPSIYELLLQSQSLIILIIHFWALRPSTAAIIAG